MSGKDIAKEETAAATGKFCDKIIELEETIGEKNGMIEEFQRQLADQKYGEVRGIATSLCKEKRFWSRCREV